MKRTMRAILGVTLGLATFLIGQLAIENAAWWWLDTTATFDDPLLNAAKFALAGSAGLAVALMIGLRPARRKRLL